MQRIIINADDLGLSKGVNEGILYCYQNGVVNSSSLLTNTDYFEETLKLIKNYKLNNIGLHFNVTEGKPVLKNHKNIVDENGQFKRNIHLANSICLQEVFNEIEAQYLKAVNAGIRINHIDSHHHVHMTKKLRKVFLNFSSTYKIPIRKINNTNINPFKVFLFYKDTINANYYTSLFYPDFYSEGATIKTFEEILTRSKSKSIEIMCHPGYSDQENGDYNEERLEELKILTEDSLKSLIKKYNSV